MKVGEMIKLAVETWNPTLAGRVSDYLHFRHGFRYDDVYDMAHRLTGVSPQNWEELMYESDQEPPPGVR